jgi:hypothetical protein
VLLQPAPDVGDSLFYATGPQVRLDPSELRRRVAGHSRNNALRLGLDMPALLAALNRANRMMQDGFPAGDPEIAAIQGA